MSSVPVDKFLSHFRGQSGEWGEKPSKCPGLSLLGGDRQLLSMRMLADEGCAQPRGDAVTDVKTVQRNYRAVGCFFFFFALCSAS